MDHLRITIPNCCTKEVKYIVHCVFDVFLGLKYSIDVSATNEDYIIKSGDHSIHIENHFFVNEHFAKLYSMASMPKNAVQSSCEIENIQYPFISMFGSSELSISNEKIHFKTDIFASIFFMLTRWEEQIITSRDEHDRFPGKESFAYKHGFLNRPIVNEYIELLWQFLLKIGYDGIRKERVYTLVPTHDIDFPLMWMDKKSIFRSLMFSIFKSRSVSEFKSKIYYLLRGEDPYDTYSEMMNLAELAGTKAIFYFLSGGSTTYDQDYSIEDQKLISILTDIQKRNHSIGIHPSYDSYRNADLLIEEINRFRNIEIKHSRQHFLRVSVPETWSIWNQVGINVDSTMGYADVAGFRCGICYKFPLFDFKSRKQLKAIEQPLIVMDVTLQKYENLNSQDSITRIQELKNKVKKYQGDFVFLWHNSSFETSEWKAYKPVFNSMYN